MDDDDGAPFGAIDRRYRLFVSVGWGAILVGLAIATWVGYEWFYRSTGHQVVALVAGVAILFGMQLLVFSFMAHMLVLLYREQRIYLEGDGEEPS